MNEVKNDNKEDIPSEPIQSHVANVVENSSDWLKNNETQTIKKSLNILILGETGVGKSTWINAFANYLTYNTLEEAITAETPICVIPTKFTLFDNNNQCHNVMLGEHENECFENAGQSATQNAKTYLFETEKYNVYLIDTPGMNDTRGIEQDEENMQKILRAISPFKELHAICFLFKPNENRLKDYFRYSINTLLRNLHKTSLRNACFVFTNTATTFYKPGETLGLLEIFFNELNEREQISVPLNDDNVFCLENEAFRFCCAYFSQVLFDSTEIETYSQSWKHSANEINRFLDYAATLCPHSTAETLSINEIKIWIMQLITPIVDVCELIQTNLQKLDDRIRELESLKNNLNELKKRKFIQTVSLEIKNLEKPQIVCTNEKCVRYENIMGHMEPIFETVCHKNCFTKSLLGCVAFGDRGKCRNCGCSYKDHMRIFYEQQIVVTDTEIEIQPSNQRNPGQMKKKLIEKTKEMIEKYNTEYNFVMVAMAKFSLFLSQNGIAQKYDIFENQIEDLIEREEKLIESVPNYEDQKYYRLTDYLIIDYRDIREKLFEENINLLLTDIQDIRQKLFAMPLMGSKIAEIYSIYVKTEENDHIENISRCDKETVKEFVLQRAYNFYNKIL
uniref:G domain-containing protein n=1 Tax=Panagrolaimus davidi TaxID=227884 RepID=A0A914Q7Q6_9BILA